MKCKNCNHEQVSGKFCGKCGKPLEEVEEATAAVEGITQTEANEEVAATVESIQPLEPTPNPVVSTPAQPNEQVERVKDTSKKYIEYIKEFAVNPSRVFNTAENQFTNAIITIAIILLLASYTIFSVIKAFYKSPIGLGLIQLYEEGAESIFGTQAFTLSLFPTYGNAFLIFLLLIGLSVAISLAVMKIAKQPLNFKRLISIYGTFLIPVVGLVVLSLLLILINKIALGLVLLIIGFSLAVYVYPLRIVFHKFGEASKIDATHRGFMYFVGISIVLYIIFTQYIKGKVVSFIELIEQFGYLFS